MIRILYDLRIIFVDLQDHTELLIGSYLTKDFGQKLQIFNFVNPVLSMMQFSLDIMHGIGNDL